MKIINVKIFFGVELVREAPEKLNFMAWDMGEFRLLSENFGSKY